MQAPAALPRSQAEDRLLKDLATRLADPEGYRDRVDREAGHFNEGRLFPYVLPILALANLSRRPGAGLPALRAEMATLLDLLLPEVAHRVGATSPAGIPDVPGYGTWQGQLALALGAYRLAGGDDRYEDLHRRLCDALLAAMVARKGAPIDAYPGLVWTFDTIPVALALALRDHAQARPGALDAIDAVLDGDKIRFGLNHNLPGARDAINAHLRWADAHLDPATGLPPARIDLGSGQIVEGPRGGDLALRIALLAQLAPVRAGAYYAAFSKHFTAEPMGLIGFGEWPDGALGKADLDSGLVLLGLGMSATGLGLGAARAAGDTGLYQRMDRELAAFPTLLPPLLPLVAPQSRQLGITFDLSQYVTGFLFGDAALLWSVTWEDWKISA